MKLAPKSTTSPVPFLVVRIEEVFERCGAPGGDQRYDAFLSVEQISKGRNPEYIVTLIRALRDAVHEFTDNVDIIESIIGNHACNGSSRSLDDLYSIAAIKDQVGTDLTGTEEEPKNASRQGANPGQNAAS